MLAVQCVQGQCGPGMSQSSDCHKVLGHKIVIAIGLSQRCKLSQSLVVQVHGGSCCPHAELPVHLTSWQTARQKPRTALLALHVTCCHVYARVCKGMQVLLTTCVMLFASQVQSWSHTAEDSKGQHGYSLQQKSCPPAQGGCNNPA